MRQVGLPSLNLKKGNQPYKWLTIYRWLALLPPALYLALNLQTNRLIPLVLFALAVINAVVQTVIYLKRRPLLKKDFVYAEQLKYRGNSRLGLAFLLAFEMLICALLNSLGSVNPYYLYTLCPIFLGAVLFGLVGAITSALILSASYLAAWLATLAIGNSDTANNWLPTIIAIGNYAVVAVLSGYLVAYYIRLRQYSNIITRYQGNLERQNRSLTQVNAQLEYLRDFNRVLQEGNTSDQIEEIALQYISRLLSSHQEPFANAPTQTGRNNAVRLLEEVEMEDWLHSAKAPLPTKPLTNIIQLERSQQIYWLAPLNFKAQQFGALAIAVKSDDINKHEIELIEQQLLLSLLADQLARVLGNLKQNQALAVATERARLAMDMHDVVAQSLFGIAYNLDACLKLFDTDLPASRQRLGDLRNLAFETLGSVRSIIYNLWNEENGDTDFASLLQNYLKKAGVLYPFQIKFEVKSEIGEQAFRLDRETQKGLYRVVQEALANAVKHSSAALVWIELCRDQQGLALQVRDNGAGFEQNRGNQIPSKSGGMGLQTMRERVEQLGGDLIIESGPKGTTVTAKLPLPLA